MRQGQLVFSSFVLKFSTITQAKVGRMLGSCERICNEGREATSSQSQERPDHYKVNPTLRRVANTIKATQSKFS